MARPTAARRLSDRRRDVTIAPADPVDAREVAELLSATSVEGGFAIAMARGSDPFALNRATATNSVFLVARDSATGELLGVCERTTRSCYIDGEPRQLPYLGALRLADRARGRLDVLRGGFRALDALQSPDETPFAVTSIADENARARRLLTSGVKGLPIYRAFAGYSTFALHTRRYAAPAAIGPATPDDLPALVAFLRERNSAFQFAPAWDVETLTKLFNLGLSADSILLWREHDRILASIAVWDQRAMRQVMVRRYPPLVSRLRPLLNLLARPLQWPPLPPVGTPLGQATLALTAAADDSLVDPMIRAALDAAAKRGFEAAAIGMASASPWRKAAVLKRSLRYATTLYTVARPDAAAPMLEPRLPHPEMGFL